MERFYDALRQERPEIACRQLSAAAVAQLESQSGQACAKVIDRLGKNGGAIVAVEVYLTNAKVDLRNDESASSSRRSSSRPSGSSSAARRSPSPSASRGRERRAAEDRPLRDRVLARVGEGQRPEDLVYGNSLLAVMLVIWLASWAAQAATGRITCHAEQFDHQQASLTLCQFVGSRTSGTGRCRTGSRSSSPSDRWSSCRSTCANGGPRSPSRSASRAPRRARRAEMRTLQSSVRIWARSASPSANTFFRG